MGFSTTPIYAIAVTLIWLIRSRHIDARSHETIYW